MARAEFEEKEFEIDANIELAMGNRLPGRVVPIGQVLEHILGFDAAAHPDAHHAVWNLLNEARPPGLHLAPTHWPTTELTPSDLPRMPVSLILQYKRPDYLRGANAAQWRLWHQPYFRFSRVQDQHRILRSLEQRTRGQAIVRYASPAFWRRGELEAHRTAGRVLAATGFVSPSQLGRHRVWTYVSPGQVGRANPSGDEWRFESLRDLGGQLYEDLQGPSRDLPELYGRRLFDHLAALGAAARHRRPWLARLVEGWSRDLGTKTRFSRRTLSNLENVAAIATLTQHVRACWLLLDLDG